MPRILFAVFSALIVNSLCGIQKLESSPRSKTISSAYGEQFERVLLRDLWPALSYGKIVGRIYYTAVCQPNKNIGASFPRLDVQPAPNGKAGVAAVRDIFRHAKDVSVTESDPGIIRIRIGIVPDDLMRVKISYLTFTAEEQYNYWLAIFKIENAQEVRSAMQNLEIGPRITANIIHVRQPAAGLPHLPAVRASVTFDHALDLVAKTFGGVILYEYCTSGTQFGIDFVGPAKIYSPTD